MGPGPDGPGKRVPVAPPAMSPVGFNGAGAGWPRKTEYNLREIAKLFEASMGPGPDGPGKLGKGQIRSRKRNCFNGAGAGWPRKTCTKRSNR